jgi:hypothetical protein
VSATSATCTPRNANQNAIALTAMLITHCKYFRIGDGFP